MLCVPLWFCTAMAAFVSPLFCVEVSRWNLSFPVLPIMEFGDILQTSAAILTSLGSSHILRRRVAFMSAKVSFSVIFHLAGCSYSSKSFKFTDYVAIGVCCEAKCFCSSSVVCASKAIFTSGSTPFFNRFLSHFLTYRVNPVLKVILCSAVVTAGIQVFGSP